MKYRIKGDTYVITRRIKGNIALILANLEPYNKRRTFTEKWGTLSINLSINQSINQSILLSLVKRLCRSTFKSRLSVIKAKESPHNQFRT